MCDEILLQVVREALFLVAAVAAPPVLAALVMGLFVGVAQAVTQVQDQALSLSFRIAAVFGALLIAGPWSFDLVAKFAVRILELVAVA